MEDRQSDKQAELLAQIYNQLVDIKQILVEAELARPGTSQAFQARLRQLAGVADHLRADGQSAKIGPHQEKTISPTDPNIQPGEGS
jgi:hypothetical protein